MNYSEIIIKTIEHFDSQIPKNLSFNEIIELTIDAFNLSINKDSLGEKMYKKELNNCKYPELSELIIVYKLEFFSDYNNRIVDYELVNNKLTIKSQTQLEYFKSILGQLVKSKPNKK